MKEKPPKTVVLTQTGLLIVGLFLLAAFLRLFYLGQMAYHHDESIHAYYSYKLYNDGRSNYTYDPTYHGPFLYHWSALIFFLFGDSDFTGRLPFVLFGMLMLYLVFRLRPLIGTPGVIFTLTAIAVSPVLTYFSRFARNDILLATMTLGIVVFAIDYFRTKRHAYLIWMLFFLGLMYCTKENSLMMGFILCSYVVLYGVYYIFCRPKETRRVALRTVLVDYAPFTKSLIIYGLFSFFTFFYSKIIISRIDWSVITGDLGLGVIRSQMDSYLSEHGSFTATWLTFAIVAAVCVFAVLWLVRRFVAMGGRDVAPEGGDRWRAIVTEYYPLVVGWAIVVGLFCLLFSTLLYNRIGLRRGLVDYFAYWIGQQSIRPRISGALSYYLPRLVLYEALPVLFAVAAYVYYLVRGVGVARFIAIQIALLGGLKQFYAHIVNPESFRANLAGHFLEFGLFMAIAGLVVAGRKIYELVVKPLPAEEAPTSPEPPVGDVDGFRMFLVYWSVSSLIIYSILNEKIPWLLTHQALPLCLLAGTFAGDLWNLLGRGAARTAVTVTFCLLALYGLRCNVLLNFYNPDNPREIMVYTQSTSDVVKVRDEVEHIAFVLGKDRFMVRRDNEQRQPSETLAAVQGEASWPFVWYFRRYRTHSAMPMRPLPPVVITDTDMDSRMQAMAGGQYTVRQYPIRSWWPPYGKTFWPFHAIDDPGQPKITNSEQAWRALQDYIWTRKVWSPVGSSNMRVYVRKDLLREVPAPKAAEGYTSAPRRLQPLAVWGSPGSGPGQFLKPKGIAVSPDGQRIYVVDSKNARIQILNANGQFQSQFGGPGDGPGQFNSTFDGPCGGIAIGSNGHVYVTDTWNNRILVFDRNGTPIDAWSKAGPGQRFFGPRGIAVAPDSRVFVADTGNKRLVVFTAEGKFLNTIGRGGAGRGQFDEPVGITVAQNREIYVADVGNKRIQVLGPNGAYRREWNILGWTDDATSMIWVEPYVAVGPDGWVYVTDSTRKIVHRFNRNGQQVVLGTVSDGFRAPKGIARDPAGNLLVVDTERAQIVKIRFP